ncbi:hypothetical protein GC176_19545 [bacterium]|nr:hypothetical protein [bacterium]
MKAADRIATRKSPGAGSVTPGDRSRLLLGLLIAVCLTAVPGCAFSRIFPRRKPDPLPRALTSDATLNDIMEHLNEQRSRVMSWRSTDVRIKASGEGIVAPKLTAALSVESPRNLRLMADSLRGLEVDFGSNDERFWYWMRAGSPKYLLTGSHAALSTYRNNPLPFPPSWLMEALGVIPIDPSGVQLLRDPATPDQVRLVSSYQLPGRSVQRIMLVDLALGEIVEHALYDDQDQLIASATLSNFRSVGQSALLPHRIDLQLPTSGQELNLTIGSIEVNPALTESTFQMTGYPNCEVVDLDQQLRGGSALR